MSTTGQSASLARPPQLYRVPSSVSFPSTPSSTLKPAPTHQSNSTKSSSRILQTRKTPVLLEITPPNAEHPELIFPLPSVTSPTSPTINQSSNKHSPSPRRSSAASNFSLSAHREFIERKSFSEITFFTAAQYKILKDLCSDKPIPLEDQESWESIIASQKLPCTNSGQDAYDVEMVTVGLAIEFATNNTKTGNFNTLLLYALSQMRQVLDQANNKEIPIQCYNSLFLIRIFLKHFIGNLTGNEINRQFEGIRSRQQRTPFPSNKSLEQSREKFLNGTSLNKSSSDKRPMIVEFLDSLLNTILKVDPTINASSYEFYQECLNTLMVLLSIQIHQPNADENVNNFFLNILLHDFNYLIDDLTKRLVINFIDHKAVPSVSTNVVYNAYSFLFATKQPTVSSFDPHPVAERSLLILLLLTAQSCASNESKSHFRIGISHLKDEQGLMGGEMEISFRSLYRFIYQQLPSEEICLLLYTFMIENVDFRVYVLSRLDPEILLLPILRVLYETVDGRTNYPQTYIMLTILLLFSQDDVFNENIQKVAITYQPWFTERILKSISLGGIIYLVMIRLIQFNLTIHRDVFIHTNCLAILANMAITVQDIHPYVSQRLVNLFDIVAKRYQKLNVKAQQGDENSTDISIYEDLACLVLEIINSIISSKLNSNLQLIYALLHKKDMFTHFLTLPRFSQLISNVDNVINYFNTRVSEANIKAPSTEEIAEIIETAARTWPPGRLQEFPELKFQYEESLYSENFFCPYIWTIIYQRFWIYWDEEKAHLLKEFLIDEEDIVTPVD
ncbi:4124_t:CDS:10 [Ambispora gerdemannii]|uniref:Dymeclin n=1 Tax=Ambispora gerdemannii TaxID=144530 RepID=A0A9N8W2N6_9GLOM|nr:4124_t:CDS:10 [Ambispora gerdemannii]